MKFAELADDYAIEAERNNRGWDSDRNRIRRLQEAFGSMPLPIPIETIRGWFDRQSWKAGTDNRMKTVLRCVFKLAIENNKITENPACLLKHQEEPEGRVRFLNQYQPDEESRLRRVILEKWPEKLLEFDIALNTGMRKSEQYKHITWTAVPFPARHSVCSSKQERPFSAPFT